MTPSFEQKLMKVANKVADQIINPQPRKDGEVSLHEAIDALKALTTFFTARLRRKGSQEEDKDADAPTFAAFTAALGEPDAGIRSRQGRARREDA